jgi:16S rRNA (cytosine1402-N4)-methyltransferase
MTAEYHTPVLADEVVRLLDPWPGQTMVDATLGGGGHALRIGARLQPGGTLIVIDQDPEALDAALVRLEPLSLTIIPIHSNFRKIAQLLDAYGIGQVHGITADLGLSSHQIEAAERGFSFRADGPLNMRMNPTEGETAAELLARLSERELTRILQEYGDERWAARIARFIVERRAREPLRTTRQLADLVYAAIPKKAHPRDIHPATRTFMALRMAVQDEPGALHDLLHDGVARLKPGGHIAIISYHSGEDRLVKQTFLRLSGRCACPPDFPECRCGARRIVDIITRKPVIPTEAERRQNPRARSARLRAARKVGG